MRVLYAANRFPKFSESYIAAEIRYAQSCGIEVAVWPLLPWESRAVAHCPVLAGMHLEEAMDLFKPDIFHIQYAFPFTWDKYVEIAASRGLPITVRAHRFPNEVRDGIRMLAEHPAVRAVFAFPQFAVAHENPKVISLPVAYDSTRFKPVALKKKNRRLVLRTVAGRPFKGLEDFMELSKRCPNLDFRIVVDSGGWEGEVEKLRDMTKAPVEIYAQIPDEEVVELVSEAGIYLSTSDPAGGKPFGMPISIAEAMGTGAMVFARAVPGMADYLGRGGALYNSVEDAEALLRGTLSWSEDTWKTWHRAALDRSLSFQDVTVLPRLIQEWVRIVTDQVLRGPVSPGGTE